MHANDTCSSHVHDLCIPFVLLTFGSDNCYVQALMRGIQSNHIQHHRAGQLGHDTILRKKQTSYLTCSPLGGCQRLPRNYIILTAVQHSYHHLRWYPSKVHKREQRVQFAVYYFLHISAK